MTPSELIRRNTIIGSTITILVAVTFSTCLPEASSAALIAAPIMYTALSVLTLKVLTTPSIDALLKFSSAFMLTNIVKLAIYLAYFVVAYLAMPGEKRVAFVVAFLALYLVYTAIDTIALLQYFKDKN